jgi:cyclic pyranopterin phosphate synthase
VRTVPPAVLESAVYSFESLLPDLESPPIAARRALDHAGFRLSVEGWRSLVLDDRQKLTLCGVPDRVDVDLIANVLKRATPAPQRISPVNDPDPSAPPEALAKALEPTRAIDPKRWSRLRAIDRYALAHTYRRAVARSAFSILGEAFDAVLAAAVPPTPPVVHDPPRAEKPPAATSRTAGPTPLPNPPYLPAGFYSNVGGEEQQPQKGRAPGYELRAAPQAATPQPPPAYDPVYRTSAAPEGATPLASIADLSNHLTQAGEVHMVDVARKPKTERRAIACGFVQMAPETLARITGHEAPKGEVLATARVAAIMAAKRTHELIPLCHAVALTHLEVIIQLDAASSRAYLTAVADTYDRTGVEMEAMVAVTVGCLTIYDMLKGMDRDMIISEVKLMEKSGGRSGHYKRVEYRP